MNIVLHQPLDIKDWSAFIQSREGRLNESSLLNFHGETVVNIMTNLGIPVMKGLKGGGEMRSDGSAGIELGEHP